MLVEKMGELSLVCLDPGKNAVRGENPVVWMQLLGRTPNQLVNDVGRRIHAAPLVYGEGVLVCPTNAGAVLGVDLLKHRLVWAYAYKDKSQPGALWTPKRR